MSDSSASTSAATDISEFITDLDGGQFDRKLSIALSQAAAASVDNQKEATVTVKFKLKPIGGSHMAHVDHTLEFKKPTESGSTSETETRTTTMHVGKFGKLSLAPENQMVMFAKDGKAVQ